MHTVDTDGEHAADIIEPVRSAFRGQKNVCVWVKTQQEFLAEVRLGLSNRPTKWKQSLCPSLILNFQWKSIIAGNRPLALSVASDFYLTCMIELPAGVTPQITESATHVRLNVPAESCRFRGSDSVHRNYTMLGLLSSLYCK